MASVLLLTKYGRLGASSRLRTLQYVPSLEAKGFDVTLSPLFSDRYLEHKYENGRMSVPHVAEAAVRRSAALLSCRRYDLIWLEKEIAPYLPGLGERLLRAAGVPYVVDYDDAAFHAYDAHRNPLIRGLLSNKIARVMRGAAMVIAGNLYLAEYAQRAGAARVEVVPTVVDLKRYCAGVRDASVPFTIGWIGSPPTARYLERVAPALAAACQGGRARVVAVGSGPVSLPAVPLEVRPWAHHTEAAEIRRFDVGIMPMPDDPWARGKCGFKLIQYMACGVPVIASPVSANLDIVSHGANGLLAASQDEWIAALEALRVDPQLRERLGTAGRHTVEQRYSLDVTAPRLADLLLQVVQGRVSGYTSAPISGILPGA